MITQMNSAGSEPAAVTFALPQAPLAMPRQVLEQRPLMSRVARRLRRWIIAQRAQKASFGR